MENPSLEIEFSRFAGEMAESLNFNKSLGQIYGLLYINETSLSLDEVAEKLTMSKGNASINLRILESWGAVKPVWVSGSRRDHYEANLKIKEVVTRRLKEGLDRRIGFVEIRLVELINRLPSKDNGDRRDRIKALQLSFQNLKRKLPLIFQVFDAFK